MLCKLLVLRSAQIPKWTRKKFEIATGEEFNPIKQDTKNGKLREYNHGDMLFNYGAFPQTWEVRRLLEPWAHAAANSGAPACRCTSADVPLPRVCLVRPRALDRIRSTRRTWVRRSCTRATMTRLMAWRWAPCSCAAAP